MGKTTAFPTAFREMPKRTNTESKESVSNGIPTNAESHREEFQNCTVFKERFAFFHSKFIISMSAIDFP
jgi:hypothetical protein